MTVPAAHLWAKRTGVRWPQGKPGRPPVLDPATVARERAEGLSLGAIARRHGVSVPAVSLHFRRRAEATHPHGAR